MAGVDVIVIGAGAAGMMCAITAGQRGRRVMVLDHAATPMEKIRISGGGRCNFTNLYATPENYLSANPRFCVSALRRYTPQDVIALVEKHAITYHEKTRGQLFCDGASRQIIDMLKRESAAAGVVMGLDTWIEGLTRQAEGFQVATNRGHVACRSLVIATGGKSIPKIGATGFGYDVARQFGLAVVPPRPGLVALTFEAGLRGELDGLAGIALEARVTCGKAGFTDGLLFTHRGLSGPAILQISSYWTPGATITVDLAPGIDGRAALIAAKQSQPRQSVAGALSAWIPKRLAQRLADLTATNGRLGDQSHKALGRLAARLNRWQVTPSGTEGYRTAEVTLGGVDTRALSSKTFAAHTVPGLYFIGEVVDVTGHLGGYNFQWAWASGYCAGLHV